MISVFETHRHSRSHSNNTEDKVISVFFGVFETHRHNRLHSNNTEDKVISVFETHRHNRLHSNNAEDSVIILRSKNIFIKHSKWIVY